MFRAFVVLLLASSPALASPVHAEMTANIGFAAPGGLVGGTARLELFDKLFIEADAGLSTAGPEVGGGIGIPLYQERAPTAKLGMARARFYTAALVTRSHTDEREAGVIGGGLPELVQGGGTYLWGYLLGGIDLKLDSHLYLDTAFGVVARLHRDATYPMDPSPDDAAGAFIRAGVGVHF